MAVILARSLVWNPQLSGALRPRLVQRAATSALSRGFCPGSLGVLHPPALRRPDIQALPSFARLFPRRPFTSVHEILANGDIPFPRVRVVDDRGLVGDFNLGEALALAKQRRTDLVVLSGAVDPPLCRLVNLHVYIDELERQAASKEQQQREQRLREFSFDPAMRVKGMRFSSVIDEHDFERKLNQVRKFLEKGHRVEARILQSRGKPEDVLDLALRIIAEVRDLAKPEYFEESIRELQVAIHSPKSLKRTGRAPPDELRMRLWPCTPAQAAAFQLPAHIIGPRRRRGPAIVGVDDGPQDDDAWKLNRRPRPESRTARKIDLRRQALEKTSQDWDPS